MANKKYRKGYNFEKKIQEKYEKEGYFVIRSSGSHGIADLVAIPSLESRYIGMIGNVYADNPPILIQCKATKKGKYTKECSKLIKIAKKYGCKAKLITKEKEIDLVL